MIASNCPPTHEIALLAADALPSDRAAVLLAHVSECGPCAKALAEAIQNLEDELTAEESDTVDHLMGFRPAAPTTRSYYWLALTAACLAMAVGLSAWFAWQRLREDPVARLLKQAYTTGRPFDWRLPDAGYGAVRIELGAPRPQLADVQEAEIQIDKDLSSNPASARTLSAKGWLALLKHDPESAIQSLEQAAQAAPQDTGIAAKLGVAYALRAETRARQGESALQASDYAAAIDRFSQVLRATPDDRMALFNRALAYLRLGRAAEARLDAEAYLLRDPSSDWSKEVRKWLSTL